MVVCYSFFSFFLSIWKQRWSKLNMYSIELCDSNENHSDFSNVDYVYVLWLVFAPNNDISKTDRTIMMYSRAHLVKFLKLFSCDLMMVTRRQCQPGTQTSHMQKLYSDSFSNLKVPIVNLHATVSHDNICSASALAWSDVTVLVICTSYITVTP